jgi:protein-S-isoprenylcysteine O-methyltransferase Ste14
LGLPVAITLTPACQKWSLSLVVDLTVVLMKSLELKVPPPLVAATVAVATWGISRVTPLLEVATAYRVWAAIAIAAAGAFFSIGGVVAFRRAQTTVNPMKPESASSLVGSGVYRITRNPMYVKLLLVLVAWATFLAAPLALPCPLAFVLYIGRFQIAPEEFALTKLFGSEYAEYKAKVRRWL